MKCCFELEVFIYNTSEVQAMENCQRKFCTKSSASVVPSKARIHRIVVQFHAMGSVLDRIKTRKKIY
jgi:hypothetical protein